MIEIERIIREHHKPSETSGVWRISYVECAKAIKQYYLGKLPSNTDIAHILAGTEHKEIGNFTQEHLDKATEILSDVRKVIGGEE